MNKITDYRTTKETITFSITCTCKAKIKLATRGNGKEIVVHCPNCGGHLGKYFTDRYIRIYMEVVNQ